jgi:hypothetical protein
MPFPFVVLICNYRWVPYLNTKLLSNKIVFVHFYVIKFCWGFEQKILLHRAIFLWKCLKQDYFLLMKYHNILFSSNGILSVNIWRVHLEFLVCSADGVYLHLCYCYVWIEIQIFCQKNTIILILSQFYALQEWFKDKINIDGD